MTRSAPAATKPLSTTSPGHHRPGLHVTIIGLVRLDAAWARHVPGSVLVRIIISPDQPGTSADVTATPRRPGR